MRFEDSFQTVLAWIRQADEPAVDARWVPGATVTELKALAALGGLARALGTEPVTPELPPEVARWLESGPNVPSEVLAAADRALCKERDHGLAVLYSSVVAGSNRRQLGTFFTPNPAASLMVDMWMTSEATPDAVIDVGAGVGVFTLLAGRKWPTAAIYSVDINPVTLGLLVTGINKELPIVAADAAGDGVRLVRADFTKWFQTEGEELAGARLILGNPPYTRAQLLGAAERKRLSLASNGLCGARASLSTFITAISLDRLRPQDGLCLLLPAQWLESDYASALRSKLANLSHRRVELRLVSSWRFPGVMVDAVALMVGTERDAPQDFRVANWTADESRTVDRGSLAVARSWRILFDQRIETGAPAALRRTAATRRLDTVATIHRGVATGANNFFVLSDEEVEEARLPKTRLLPVVRRLYKYRDHVDSSTFNSQSRSEKRWLLDASRKYRTLGSFLDSYLAAGEAALLSERHLCQVRRPDWYDLGSELSVPHVILGPMTRGAVRLLENQLKAVITNNLYGLTWNEDISGCRAVQDSALVAWSFRTIGPSWRCSQPGKRPFEARASRSLDARNSCSLACVCSAGQKYQWPARVHV